MELPQAVRSRPPPPPAVAERRRAERLELLAQVELRRDGEVVLLPTINISAGGLLLGVESGALSDVEIGEEVHVFLATSEGDSGSGAIELSMDATIVRVIAHDGVPNQIGLMWSSIDLHAMGQLAKLLEYARTRM